MANDIREFTQSTLLDESPDHIALVDVNNVAR